MNLLTVHLVGFLAGAIVVALLQFLVIASRRMVVWGEFMLRFV